MNGDPLLTAFVRVRSDGGAQTLAVSAAVTVASVCEAVPIEPGHVHLDQGDTRSEPQHKRRPSASKPGPNLATGGRTRGGLAERESSFQ